MGSRLASERCSLAVCCDSTRLIRAIQAGPSESPLHAQHRPSPARRASTTGRAAATPTRLVWCKALLGVAVIWATALTERLYLS